jgi:hypothetical protein
LILHTELTLRSGHPIPQSKEFGISIAISGATAHNEERNMKQPKGHPDGPTPANSPQKKHVRVMVQDVSNLPSPWLLFPSAATRSPSPENDVFGTKVPNGPRESGSMAGTLFSFWQRESVEEKTECNYRDLEDLWKMKEQRKLAEDWMVAMRKD